MLPQWTATFEDNRLTEGSPRQLQFLQGTTRGLVACKRKLPVTHPDVPKCFLAGRSAADSRALDDAVE